MSPRTDYHQLADARASDCGMSDTATFLRQVRSRSQEHREAMWLMKNAGLAGQMVAILRQELDSMVRVIYLLEQKPSRRAKLIAASVSAERWHRQNSHAPVTDREMVELAQSLQGWTQSVYKFGCAFIHLSALHDYNDRDPFALLPPEEKADILEHCRSYHGGPIGDTAGFRDLIPLLPLVFAKIADNLECYLKELEGAA